MANWYEGTFNFPSGSCGIAASGMDFDPGTLYHYSFTVASDDPGTPYAGSFGIQKICSSPLGAAPAAGILKHTPDGGIGPHSGSGSFVAGANATGTDLHFAVATMAMAPGSTGTCTFVINPDGWVGGDPPTPPPPPGIEPGVYDENMVFLADLDDATNVTFKVELQDTGSGRVVLPRSSPNATAAILKKGNWIKVTVPQIHSTPIFLFAIEKLETTVLAEGEEGEEEIVITGRGGLIYPDRVRAWNESFVVPAGNITDGVWHGPASTGNKVGQILRRGIDEWQHVNRPAHPIPLLDATSFDYTNDSDGNPWATTPMTAELSQGYSGESGMVGIYELIGTGAIDIIIGPDLTMDAYNHYGRDLTGAAFGAGVVRFVRGENIATSLRRQIGTVVDPTHTLVQGDSDSSWALAISPLAGSTPDVEGYVRAPGTNLAMLEAIGLADMARRLRQGESIAFAIKVPPAGELPDPENGLYLPGWDWTDNGQFWIGDTVTLDTGSGFHDFDETDVRVMAITIGHDDAGNLTVVPEFQATVLTGRPYPSAFGGGSSGGASSTGGTAPAPAPAAVAGHTHAHAETTGQTPDDHHDEDHASRHGDGALDELAVTDLGGFPGGTTDFLRADGTFAAPPAAGDLDDLTDVDLTGLADNDILQFDLASGLWLPVDPPSGSVPSGTDPGDLLIWDGSAWDVLPIGADDETLIADSGEALGVRWGTASGGGGVQLSGLDRAPASPHAKDDEFEGGSLDAKWTIPASSGADQGVTATLENGVVAITPTTAGSASTGKRFFGISQAAPSGSFSVRAKLGEAGQGTDRRHGLYVAVAGSTGHIIGPFAQDNRIAARGVTTTSTTGDWSAVDGFSILSALMPTVSWPFPAWVRIDWDAGTSTLTFYASLHGLVWVPIGSRSSMSQPSTFGICLYSNGATVRADDVLAADWVRVVE